MDDKLRSVLGNPELMARIAAAVNGTAAEEPVKEVYASPVQEARSDKALALLSALAPFLSERRRTKLDGITKAMTVAGVYKGVKKI